jgi:AraC family transcriptional regulator, transcriptional activator of pobA
MNAVKESIVTKVYHLTPEMKVPLHEHADQDEVFYCMKGSGFGVLEDGETELTVGQAFIVRAGIKHSLRTEGDLYVGSFLLPVIEE